MHSDLHQNSSRNSLNFPHREGNRIETLVNGDEIFEAMLSAIREARDEILLETYIYWDGQIGRQFAESLAAASQRGVCVCVVIDAYGSTDLGEKLIELMREAGVKVHLHRPIEWLNLNKSNHRSHRKLMVVDGTIGFIGGVGIADEWTGEARNPNEWRDNHYRIEGPVVSDMHSLFFTHWESDDARDSSEPTTVTHPDESGHYRCQLVASDPLHEKCSFLDLYAKLLNGAQRRVRIISPYFVLNDEFLKLVEKTAERGVEIEIISAGQHNDKRVTRLASRHDWGGLLKAGVRIFEYNKTLIHVKLFLADDDQLLIGSANFDVRSMTLNEEASLLVTNRELASEHHQLFEDDLACAEEIHYDKWKSRPWTTKAFDSVSHCLRPML
ncbi:phosphatidylserine/phosphatidylglycerophosphate/cardiolipin synthase family protein [Haloferula chungangensis]|uniref:Phosphatidylserine/phosphatidylglycerophosphate/ cardiolipin synthase family protein n=1 Tax=Haloferula chungangensis TaxID=1048331 RepID=A0ABW2L3A7_9BACT